MNKGYGRRTRIGMVLDTKGKKVCNRVYGWCHKKDGHYSTTCPKNPNNFDKLQKVLNRGKGKRGRPRGSVLTVKFGKP